MGWIVACSAEIGNTPCVKLNDRLAPEGRTIYLKLEYFNPLGSVKDRLTARIENQGEREIERKEIDVVPIQSEQPLQLLQIRFVSPDPHCGLLYACQLSLEHI